ncbi:hypothetical protein J2Z69_003513 [Paenibacillus shirakamiensis]|uniref:Transglutaminase-like domain-containing protein n=1 Tax=Paenibacillus shirakamiensis TaxID=1265935 RepID=A0ABS4JL36_9BACL|nr:transglutaminase domain-containing protein [Paenibacillus shirakamiensis]MBP2002440.1 hypothetical protein [Paenibacillus shirakamiensis]
MKNIRRVETLSFILCGSLLLGAVPSTMHWNTVYASADTSSFASRQQIEAKILQAAQHREETISFKYKGPTSSLKTMLTDALNTALEQDVYTKYVVDSYAFSWRGNETSASITVRMTYRETAAQTAYVAAQVKAIINSLKLTSMNEHEKVKAIHDWVVLHLKYDQSLGKYTAYEGLKTGEAVCQGYSLLTFRLLKEAGILSLIAEGSAGGQLHAWNLIQLDGRWYHMDTTWDDPVPDQLGKVHYNYYLRTDAQMAKDHVWKKPVPAAVSNYRMILENTISSAQGSVKTRLQSLQADLNYDLYQNGKAVHTAEGLKQKVQEAMAQGITSITLRYTGTVTQLHLDLPNLYDLDIDAITYSSEPLEDTRDLKVKVNWNIHS